MCWRTSFYVCYACALCRSGLHDPDAAGQSELVHKSVDLHSVFQQHVQRASKPPPLSPTTWPAGLHARRLNHHTHLHHQGQPLLTQADEMERNTLRHAWKHMAGCTCIHCKDVLLHANPLPPPPPPPPASAEPWEQLDLHQMLGATKGGCTVSSTSVCNHLSAPPQHWGRVSL